MKNNRSKEQKTNSDIDILTEFSIFEETLNNLVKLRNRVKNGLIC